MAFAPPSLITGIHRLGQSLPASPLRRHLLLQRHLTGIVLQNWTVNPGRISRHARALSFYEVGFRSPLDIDVLKSALPHLTLFRNLLELEVANIDYNFTSHDVLISPRSLRSPILLNRFCGLRYTTPPVMLGQPPSLLLTFCQILCISFCQLIHFSTRRITYPHQ